MSRTAKGYSIEATLDIGQSDGVGKVVIATEPSFLFGKTSAPDDIVAALSAFQIAALKAHMEALGKEFPREDACSP